jgi:hypothetical protein
VRQTDRHRQRHRGREGVGEQERGERGREGGSQGPLCLFPIIKIQLMSYLFQ